MMRAMTSYLRNWLGHNELQFYEWTVSRAHSTLYLGGFEGLVGLKGDEDLPVNIGGERRRELPPSPGSSP
jgi:hypothetical protein